MSTQRSIRRAGFASMIASLMLVAAPLSQADTVPQMSGGGQQFGPQTTSQFSVSAHGTGNSATGSLFAVPTGSFRAVVTCLQTSGNDGIATAVITSSTDALNPPGEVLVGEGVDNGNPSGGTSPDLWRLSFQNNGGIFPSGEPGCSLPIFPPVSVQQGNLLVASSR